MILVDTSIWLNLLGRSPAYDLKTEQIFQFITCPPVLQEVLQGIRLDAHFSEVETLFLALPIVGSPLGIDTFLEAARIFRRGRKIGKTIRSATDCLVAALAIEHGLPIWHRDRDYDVIAEFTDLKIAYP